MFRLGRQRIAAHDARRLRRARQQGIEAGGFMSTGALESLLDDDDLKRDKGWEDWRGGETVHQVGECGGGGGGLGGRCVLCVFLYCFPPSFFFPCPPWFVTKA